MTPQSTSTARESSIIQVGDSVYLEHMTGKYLSNVNRGRYSWPILRKAGVKLEIQSREDGELVDGSVIQLKSNESEIGDRNILGAFMDSHDCYYWGNGYSYRKQGWQIKKRNSSGDNKIRYGDEVYLTNLYYKNQKLSRCSWYEGYITTFPHANEWWTIKAEETRDENSISSEAAFLESKFEPNTRKFSQANLAYLAYCAETVYYTPSESKAKLEQLGFSIQAHNHFIDFPDTNTQCIIVGDEEKIIIAFRGTENLQDWRTNINLFKAAWKVGMVHSGFYKSLTSVWPEAMNRLQSLRTNNQPIWLTGHSLGGALATLACATFNSELPDYEIAGIYTFGQPRVGDRIFCRACDEVSKARFFRVVNNNDIVPRIPKIKYGHVGTLIYFDPNGKMYHNSGLTWGNRFKGYHKSAFNLDSDDVGDHRMGDYRILTMRHLEA
ncbi:MAG: lipase family protein [Cyanobacteria bacterium P01_A01_bin.68]